jgi:hypothetical protein
VAHAVSCSLKECWNVAHRDGRRIIWRAMFRLGRRCFKPVLFPKNEAASLAPTVDGTVATDIPKMY